MARTRKHSRRHRKGSRKYSQRGGDGYGYQGAAFAPAGPMAPVESRVDYSHCGFPARPGSLVGGARKHKNRKGRRTHRRQQGGSCSGGCAPMTPQTGGGGGTGGYGFNITNNELGKVYSSLDVGSCPPPIRPGAQTGGNASMADTRAVVSYPAGYGFAPESVREINSGTAHYLDQISYGRQCMGGGARRKSHKGRKGSRKAYRKSYRKGRRHSRK